MLYTINVPLPLKSLSNPHSATKLTHLSAENYYSKERGGGGVKFNDEKKGKVDSERNNNTAQ